MPNGLVRQGRASNDGLQVSLVCHIPAHWTVFFTRHFALVIANVIVHDD